jgi:endonuclease YncB( thermonuclease family)
MRYLILLILTFTLHAETGVATVIRVSDGDTVTVLIDEQKFKCRLYGIDAPEKEQPYGEDSRRYLMQMTLGKNVGYDIKGKDMYGRLVCILFIATPQGDQSVNEKMLEMGLAWAYVPYLKQNRADLKKYLELQTFAMKNKIGLWQDLNPQAPWEYRRENKKIGISN